MKTKITELLGIEYPIIQGGMAWVAEWHLASAVSEAGGMGLIGAGNNPMVGMTVAVAVSIEEAAKANRF